VPSHGNAIPGFVSITPVTYLAWRDPSGASIPPGGSLTEVHVRSSLRPGYTLFFARSAEDYDLPVDLPGEVQKQLDAMRVPTSRDRCILTIGPRFPREWRSDIVASEFKHAVQRLLHEGRLAPGSRFVSAVNSYFDSLSVAGDASPRTNFGGAPLASTEEERALARAIALSLR
jgi:hypothetical protein